MGNIDTLYRSSSFDTFVSNLPYILLKAQKDMPPDMVRDVYTAVPWNPAQGDRVSFDAISLPQFGERLDGENAQAKLMRVASGDTMTVRQVEYGARFEYTHRMDTFDKHKVASMFASTILSGINRILDKEMTDKVLTDAEDSTYQPKGKAYTVDWTCANDQPLASTAHTVTSGGTFSTEYTTAGALSGDTIAAMEEQARNGTGKHINHLGEPLDIEMDTLIIPKNNHMIKKAFELFGSPLDPATGNNTANIYHTQWNKKIIVLNKALVSSDGVTALTTDTAKYRYALVDSRYMGNWQYQVSDAPKIQIKDTDMDTVMKVILGLSYAAFATVMAQGYMIHRQNVSKPQVND